MRARRKTIEWIRGHLAELAMAGLAGAWACGSSTAPVEPAAVNEKRSAVADVAAKVAQAAAAVTGQDAKLANDYEKGHYVGFDTHTYPGSATMHAWKQTPGAPYSWVGYYLPAPCHNDKSWVGKRDTLRAMGWGIAVVYVGQQTWGKAPRNLTTAQRAAIRARN